jgi:hypothetical protein
VEEEEAEAAGSADDGHRRWRRPSEAHERGRGEGRAATGTRTTRERLRGRAWADAWRRPPQRGAALLLPRANERASGRMTLWFARADRKCVLCARARYRSEQKKAREVCDERLMGGKERRGKRAFIHVCPHRRRHAALTPKDTPAPPPPCPPPPLSSPSPPFLSAPSLLSSDLSQVPLLRARTSLTTRAQQWPPSSSRRRRTSARCWRARRRPSLRRPSSSPRSARRAAMSTPCARCWRPACRCECTRGVGRGDRGRDPPSLPRARQNPNPGVLPRPSLLSRSHRSAPSSPLSSPTPAPKPWQIARFDFSYGTQVRHRAES